MWELKDHLEFDKFDIACNAAYHCNANRLPKSRPLDWDTMAKENWYGLIG